MTFQLFNRKGEILQFALGFLVLTLFIVYNLDPLFKVSENAKIAIICGIAGIVVFILRTTMKNKAQVKPVMIWESKKSESFRLNYLNQILPSVIFLGLSLFHIYLYSMANDSLTYILIDYGVAGAAMIFIKSRMNRKWNLGIYDKGLGFGSKFEHKIIEWKDINGYSENNGIIKIHCSRKISAKEIALVKVPNKELAQNALNSFGLKKL